MHTDCLIRETGGLGCQREWLVLKKKGFTNKRNGLGKKWPQKGGGEDLGFALAGGKILKVRKDPRDPRGAWRGKLGDPREAPRPVTPQTGNCGQRHGMN